MEPIGERFVVLKPSAAAAGDSAPVKDRTVGGSDAIVSSIAASYRPRAFPGFELTAVVDNLWNSDYQEVPAVPAAPRRWSVGLAYRW